MSSFMRTTVATLLVVGLSQSSAAETLYDICLGGNDGAPTIAHVENSTDAEFAQRLIQLGGKLETIAAEIPVATSDPFAILELGLFEPQEMTRWVSENTGLVPYTGSLRGPVWCPT